MTNPVSIDALESRAAEQRRHLHQSVEDLRGAVRKRLDVKANARQYMLPASGVLAAFGVAAGYWLTGVVYGRRR